jgi:hypothetical protein
MADDQRDIDEVKQHLEDIRARRHSRVNWKLSKHTAELAIGAIEVGPKRPRRPAGGKSRRRKKWKRLL